MVEARIAPGATVAVPGLGHDIQQARLALERIPNKPVARNLVSVAVVRAGSRLEARVRSTTAVDEHATLPLERRGGDLVPAVVGAKVHLLQLSVGRDSGGNAFPVALVCMPS